MEGCCEHRFITRYTTLSSNICGRLSRIRYKEECNYPSLSRAANVQKHMTQRMRGSKAMKKLKQWFPPQLADLQQISNAGSRALGCIHVVQLTLHVLMPLDTDAAVPQVLAHL